MNLHSGLRNKILFGSSVIICWAASLLFAACNQERYDIDDYYKIEKIDAHVHLNAENNAWIDLAKKDNFKLLSINVDYSDFNPVDEQYRFAIKHLKENPGIFAFASTFYMKGWDDSDWVKQTISHLDSTFAEGAIAVKVWKNIGMEFKDKSGKLVMIDDPKLYAIFKHIRENDIILIGHQGEPRDCWLPVNQMMNNDMKEYFTHHPQYYMYLHPEMPSYEDQINARNRMLDRNPGIAFMGAHAGSLEWNLDELGKFFNKYPNAVVDLGARMGHMQYHAMKDREKTREFFIKYQDRILYATDNVQANNDDVNAFKKAAHEKWLSDWKFLVTDSIMRVKDVDSSFRGLALPKNAIDKIYKTNAEKLFKRAWK